MKVVLTQDVDKLGRLGDTKEVANGFAVNWLIPKGFALLWVSGEAKRLTKKRAWLDRKAEVADQTKPQPAPTESKSHLRKTERTRRDKQKIKQFKEGIHGTRLRAR